MSKNTRTARPYKAREAGNQQNPVADIRGTLGKKSLPTSVLEKSHNALTFVEQLEAQQNQTTEMLRILLQRLQPALRNVGEEAAKEGQISEANSQLGAMLEQRVEHARRHNEFLQGILRDLDLP